MNPEEDTEWNDILRKHGILGPQIKITQNDIYDSAVARAQEEEATRLERLDLDELAEVEDSEDDQILEHYRQQRMQEMRAQVAKERFGTLEQISEPDYKSTVTDASTDVWVVVHLFREYIPECKLMNRFLSELAQEYRATKFVKIVSVECIHNYPDANLPTLLVYGKGDMQSQMVRLDKYGGMRAKKKDVEKYLVEVGAVDPSMKRSIKDESEDEDEPVYFDLGKSV